MWEPNISAQVAPIYTADLLYEQNCKCGTTEVLLTGESWVNEDGDNVWRIDILDTGGLDVNRPLAVLGSLVANNISAANCTKLVNARYVTKTSIFGDFTAVSLRESAGAVIILYKDCSQS